MEGRVLVFLPVFSSEEWQLSCMFEGVFLASGGVFGAVWQLKVVLQSRKRVLGAGFEQRRLIFSVYAGVCVAVSPLSLAAGEEKLLPRCSRRNLLVVQED